MYLIYIYVGAVAFSMVPSSSWLNLLALAQILLYPFGTSDMVSNHQNGEKAMEKVNTYILQAKVYLTLASSLLTWLKSD